jgi:hypothetical protein
MMLEFQNHVNCEEGIYWPELSCAGIHSELGAWLETPHIYRFVSYKYLKHNDRTNTGFVKHFSR